MKPRTAASLGRNRQGRTALARFSARAGFTFLEIMMVVVIIGILVSMVGPRLVGRAQTAKITATRVDMRAIEQGLKEFEMNAGKFPSKDEGLKALMTKPSSLDDQEWNGAYLDRLPNDHWGNPFQYEYPGKNHPDFDLWSWGPDEQSGTDDDITNWEDLDDSK